MTVNGGEGNDTIIGGGGNEILNGDGGNDTITVGPGNNTVADGAGDDFVDFTRNSVGVVYFTGGGNDTIVGSRFDDNITGSAGNDRLDGAGGQDTLNGGLGINVLLGGPGADMIVGAGGNDTVDGGDDPDVYIFSGGAAAPNDAIAIGPDATPPPAGAYAKVRISNPPAGTTALLSDIEQLNVNTLGSAGGAPSDVVTIDSLRGTELEVVEVDAGFDVGNRLVLNGSDAAETVSIGVIPGRKQVLGLGPVITLILFGPSDQLDVFGGGGDDIIRVDNPAVGGALGLILEGGPGNDILKGGSGKDELLGQEGDDTLVFSNGGDTFDGGGGFDTILVEGTPGNDTIDVDQPAPNVGVGANYTLNVTISGVNQTGTILQDNAALDPNDKSVLPTVEEVRIEAGAGDDLIRVGHSDAYSDLLDDNGVADQTLRFTVHGGEPNASDRLVVRDEGEGDLVLYRKGADGRSGVVKVGYLAPVVFSQIERLDLVPLDNVDWDSDGDTGIYGDGRLIVFAPDPFELNDTRRAATDFDYLGRVLARPNIDPGGLTDPFEVPGDEDWYQFVAPNTSTFRFDLLFETVGTLPNGRPGLPGDGKLWLDVYGVNSETGNFELLASGEDFCDGQSATIGTRAGQTYWLRVRGADPDPVSPVVNLYDLKAFDVDYAGPHVTNVVATDCPDYNLFAPKPAVDGPTPLINSLAISLENLPARSPGYLYEALDADVSSNPGHYRLVGDANGVIPIACVEVINDPVVVGEPATATVVLSFATPLPDDRFTLTIFDTVRDPSGNKLDGESNLIEPHESPAFPSGDGVPGGNFVARFTVDSRPEIGVWAKGSVYVDTNGNWQWDPTNTDFTNRDITYAVGKDCEEVFVGNFAGPGDDGVYGTDDDPNADGFDKLATYGKIGTQKGFKIDTDNNGVPDVLVVGTECSIKSLQGIPVAGNFDGNEDNGDEVGLFSGGTWWIDTNHDFRVDTRIKSLITGRPLVGDFDGDGKDDLATYGGKTFYFDLANDGLGCGPVVKLALNKGDFPNLPVSATGERPVVADMNGDGIDDLGLFYRAQSSAASGKTSDWYFLVSNASLQEDGSIAPLDHPYTPVPFGQDLYAQFGSQDTLPLVGNFDPPVKPSSQPIQEAGPVILALAGTTKNDSFLFTPGSKAGTWTVTVNGKATTYTGTSIDVQFDGLTGRDAAVLKGGAGEDQAELRPGAASLVGAGYKVQVNAESITVNAGGGPGKASFYGAAGAIDYFTGTATYATMSDTAKGTWKKYSNRANGFTTVEATSTLGDRDQASLYGTSAAETFTARGTTASFLQNSVNNFRYVTAYGSGADIANLYATGANDIFTGSPKSSVLSGTNFSNTASGFREVHGYGIPGGTNKATLTDATFKAVAEAGASWAKLSSLDAKNPGVVWAHDFSQVTISLKNKASKKMTTAAVDFVLK